MKYDELGLGRKVYALINTTGRTGWESTGSRWMTVEIVRRDVDHMGGPVYVNEANPIEKWIKLYADKRRGTRVLVRTVDSDKAKGEPGYSKPGQYYVVGKGQIRDFDGYRKATQAQRERQEAREAERLAEYEAQEARKQQRQQEAVEALIAAEFHCSNPDSSLSGYVAKQLRRLVAEGKIEVIA